MLRSDTKVKFREKITKKTTVQNSTYYELWLCGINYLKLLKNRKP